MAMACITWTSAVAVKVRPVGPIKVRYVDPIFRGPFDF